MAPAISARTGGRLCPFRAQKRTSKQGPAADISRSGLRTVGVRLWATAKVLPPSDLGATMPEGAIGTRTNSFQNTYEQEPGKEP
jgi:hypothetical protein